MPLGTYILDKNGQPVPEPNFNRWCRWFAKPENRVIWRDGLRNGVLVSTVFLGIDHNFSPSGRGPPVLWETIIFGGPLDGYQQRYRSSGAAFKGHKEALGRAKKATSQKPGKKPAVRKGDRKNGH